jgi:uncharacterized protein YdhG (YjbR/CyaY superfamily)
MNSKKTYKSVAEYIDDQNEDTRKALLEVKACIAEAAPDAEELFNYDIPAFALVKKGKRDQQILIAGYEKHVGFYPHPDIIDLFKNELSAYKMGKGSVQFPNGKAIPKELIIRMVRKRLEMLIAGKGDTL